jgi:hypothetical protein
LEIKTWGTKWKRTIDKIDEWAASQWAKAKIDQKKSCINKTNYKHSKGGYGRLRMPWILKIMHKFEEANSRTFFHKFSQ